MTNVDIKEYMDKLNDKMDGLIGVVTPIVTKMAVLEEKQVNLAKQQDDSSKTKLLYTIIGFLISTVLSLAGYIIKNN